MCDPTTIAVVGLALSAASTYVAYDTADTNAKAQQKALDKAEDLNQMDLARQRDQEYQAGAQQMNEAAIQARKDMALFDTITGEYGGGATADRGRAVLSIQHGEDLAVIDRNLKTGMSENGFASAASIQQTNSRLASINRPSIIGSSLQLGASGLNIYADYRKRTAEVEAQKQAQQPAKGSS